MSTNELSRSKSLAAFFKRVPQSVSLSQVHGFGILSECWPFTTERPDGYASFGGRTGLVPGEIYSHRIMATLVWGPIPAGWEVDHLCRRRNCVNPLHLRICRLADNRPGGAVKNRCPRGHLKTGSNLYVNPRTGQRACRECQRIAQRAWHHANRERENAKRAARRRA